MTAKAEPLAYRINDAARVAGLGRTKIYQLIADGRLQAIRVGGRRLIPAWSLRSLIGAQELSHD